MDVSPQVVRTAEFKTVKRGLDPEEVRRFLSEVADELERSQNQSTAMEARARAAVARLQELSDGAESQAASSPADEAGAATAEQVETISRTLLLAQRTADTTIAQAEAESERVVSAARDEAASTLDSTREMAARLMEEARDEARKVGESERLAVSSEVESLKARRDFLESDVDHLEQFLVAQRERLREAATSMIELSERVPGGLGEVRRPLLSAADDEADDDGALGDEGMAEDAAALVEETLVGEAFVEEAIVAEGIVAEGIVEGTDGADVEPEAVFADDVPAIDEEDWGEESAASPAEEPDELVILADVADLPPEDAESADQADGTPATFGIADVSDRIERPSDSNMRFTFDDRT